jgi:hypothetical protein
VMAFLLGCLFSKKRDVERISLDYANESDVKVDNPNLNTNDSAASMNPYLVSPPIYHEFNEYRQSVVSGLFEFGGLDNAC